jgi:peptidyl-prolyl cis-trans isomerase SurA
MSSPVKIALAIIFSLINGCNNAQEPPSEPPPPPAQSAPRGQPGAKKLEAKGDNLETGSLKPEKPQDPSEACGQVIVVAWKGASHAGPHIVADKPQARERAQRLLALAKTGPDFATLARQNSDAASSGRRGGMIGTYKIDKWPQIHLPIRDTVFSLMVRQIADEPVETPYGYVIVRRCPVERVHTRHILVRYKGANNAAATLARTREEAKKLAEQIRAEVTAPGADFAKLAKERSEDNSARNGGDIGSPARGMLAPAFEDALFSLKPEEISPVIETEYGFHIIQRLSN